MGIDGKEILRKQRQVLEREARAEEKRNSEEAKVEAKRLGSEKFYGACRKKHRLAP